jgi:hypothetical protein
VHITLWRWQLTPIGLFPAAKEEDPMWKDRVDHAKEVWALFLGPLLD